MLEIGTAQLWWAGKEMMRGKKLADYIGKNEKTTIIAKLQKVRQPLYYCTYMLVLSRKAWGHLHGNPSFLRKTRS